MIDNEGGRTMETKVGNIFRNLANGYEYVIRMIANEMAVLESRDGKSQVPTNIKNLGITTFYQKMEETRS